MADTTKTLRAEDFVNAFPDYRSTMTGMVRGGEFMDKSDAVAAVRAARAPLLAEIERLTAELAEATRRAEIYRNADIATQGVLAEVQTERDAAQAERDAALVDAERYRWLRELPVQPTGEDLDKVIDAARKEPTHG